MCPTKLADALTSQAMNQKTKKRILNLALIAICVGLAIYVVFGTSVLQGFARAGKTKQEAKAKQLKEKALIQLGVVQDRRLSEISGIDTSLKYPDSFWVHNDSGNPAELFLISAKGHTKARVVLKGAANVDWEDLCVCRLNGKPYICIADVGDNAGQRESCQLYLFEEPDLPSDDLEFTFANDNLQKPGSGIPVAIDLEVDDFQVLDFKYQDGPRNCEAIAIYGQHRTVFLFEKAVDRDRDPQPVGVYKLRLKKSDLSLLSNLAQRIARLNDRIITGADMSADGKTLLTCNYVAASKHSRRLAATWTRQLQDQESQRIGLPVQRQGEAICFSQNEKSAIVVSEFGKQPIWKINLEMALKASSQNKPEQQRREVE